MSEFIRERNSKSAIRVSEIVTVRYAINKGNVATITFKLSSGEEVYWFDYNESDAQKIIESL